MSQLGFPFHFFLRLLALGGALTSLPACGSAQRTPDSPLSTLDERDPVAQAEELFESGQRFAQQGDSVRAEHYLTAALERGAPPERVVPLLVAVCLEGSRLRAALEHAEPYLQTHPEDLRLRLLVAVTHIALGQAAPARATLDLALQSHPDHPEAHYLLGTLLARHFVDFEAATVHFERYLELDRSGAHAAEVKSWLNTRAELEPTHDSERYDELSNEPYHEPRPLNPSHRSEDAT